MRIAIHREKGIGMVAQDHAVADLYTFYPDGGDDGAQCQREDFRYVEADTLTIEDFITVVRDWDTQHGEQGGECDGECGRIRQVVSAAIVMDTDSFCAKLIAGMCNKILSRRANPADALLDALSFGVDLGLRAAARRAQRPETVQVTR